MTDERIEGVEQLAALSKRLRTAGEKDLKREFNRSLRDASKKPISSAKANAERLPRKGGLAEKVANSRIVQRNRLSAKNPTLAIQATNDVNLWRLDRGQIRHPVFGNKEKWVTQTLPRSGWWSDAMKEAQPEAQRELAKALDRIQRKLEAPTHEFGSRGEFT